jgi:hypothetical protein
MSRKTICLACFWNDGVKLKKNVFGLCDSVRECGYFGAAPAWGAIKKCAGWTPSEIKNQKGDDDGRLRVQRKRLACG